MNAPDFRNNGFIRRPLKLVWMQSGGCGGCTLSLLGAEGPDLITSFEAAGIEVLWHPSLSELSGREASSLLERVRSGEEPIDIFCLEGSVMRGPGGTGRFHIMSGTNEPVMAWIEDIAQKARYVVAVGSCAAYGGIPAALPNPTGAVIITLKHAGSAMTESTLAAFLVGAFARVQGCR